ncbi:MAG: tripartite tricarboxylate transporter permease [Dehalococcoidia bacterium]|nr:tripartite tricarboxylate transporter permease [Dehalococcoidia bacterium]
MLEAFVRALGNIAQLDVMLVMLLGVTIGLIFGIVPGIGGMAGIAIFMSFIWGQDPILGLTFILAIAAASSQGGSVTTILLNVPGDTTNAATLLDGYPMAAKGQAGRAMGIVLTASGLGGLFGGLVLLGMLPVMRPVVLAFGSPETFMMVVLGLTFMAIIARESLIKGFVAGCLGLILAFIGLQNVTGIVRYDFFNWLYLEDGIQLIPLSLGIFAIPEVIEMMVGGETFIQKAGITIRKGGDVLEGVKDVFRHFFLFIRCCFIGTVVGIIPGIGAHTATFMAYGHAKQTSKHPEEFGQGSVEGVIAPESASNAKEGGSLLTTLGFGIPGSSAMALLLGAFLVVGVQPGPKMLVEYLDLSIWLGWTIIIGNLLSSFVLLLLARQMVRIIFLDARILAPVILVFVVIGAYAINQNFMDVIMAFVFGGFGFAAKRLGYPRVPVMLGFVLGKLAETYFLVSIKTTGPFFVFTKPICLIIFIVILITLAFDQRSKMREKRKLA